MERSTGRPVVWATAQYLSFARPPAVLDIEVVAMVTGHQTSQARAVGRVDDDEILTVNAALGTRADTMAGQWAELPDVPPPDECPPRTDAGPPPRHADRPRSRCGMANARDLDELPGPPGDGRSALWARIPGPRAVDRHARDPRRLRAVRHQPGARRARRAATASTTRMRVARRVPTEWVLLDIRIHAVADGFGHGLVHLWAEDGTLLGHRQPVRHRPPVEGGPTE